MARSKIDFMIKLKGCSILSTNWSKNPEGSTLLWEIFLAIICQHVIENAWKWLQKWLPSSGEPLKEYLISQIRYLWYLLRNGNKKLVLEGMIYFSPIECRGKKQIFQFNL